MTTHLTRPTLREKLLRPTHKKPNTSRRSPLFFISGTRTPPNAPFFPLWRCFRVLAHALNEPDVQVVRSLPPPARTRWPWWISPDGATFIATARRSCELIQAATATFTVSQRTKIEAEPPALTSVSGRTARLAQRVSDPFAHNLHDQPFPRCDAEANGGRPAGFHRDVGDARHTRLGGRMVGYAGDDGRSDRRHHRRGAG